MKNGHANAAEFSAVCCGLIVSEVDSRSSRDVNFTHTESIHSLP
jgi:hypothetical protein